MIVKTPLSTQPFLVWEQYFCCFPQIKYWYIDIHILPFASSSYTHTCIQRLCMRYAHLSQIYILYMRIIWIYYILLLNYFRNWEKWFLLIVVFSGYSTLYISRRVFTFMFQKEKKLLSNYYYLTKIKFSYRIWNLIFVSISIAKADRLADQLAISKLVLRLSLTSSINVLSPFVLMFTQVARTKNNIYVPIYQGRI